MYAALFFLRALYANTAERINSPEFKAKFDDKGIGTIEYDGETVRCYISDIEVESLCGDAGRYLDGRIARVVIAKKRTFTIKEL